MSKPIAPAKGIAFAFPDVCKTPSQSGFILVPYPNVAQLKDAKAKTDVMDKKLVVGSDYVLLEGAEIDSSSGNEAGTLGGIKSGKTKGKCKLTGASKSVKYGPDKLGIVRFMDTTEQNDGNAQGVVLSAFPTVLVGE